MQRQKRSPLLLMALTILVDFTGFGLILPLLPFWAQHLGAAPIGIGLLLAIYAAAQFVFTPILGTLSDRYGRKPIILLSLLIEALSLALTAQAGSFPVLLLARLIGGLGASNIGSAQAVVADVTAPNERARGMGFIGAAIGLGFVIGPALGGVLAPLGATLPFWVAAGVALVNATLVALFLPETRRAVKIEEVSKRKSNKGLSIVFSGWRSAVKHPIVLRLVLVNLLFTLAFTAMESIFALFTQRTFGWGASENGYVFTFVGVIVVIMQGGLVGQLVKRWGEQRVLVAGLIMLATGLLLLAFSSQLSWLLMGLGILSIGDGAVTPTVSTLLSFASTAQTQGETLGFSQGMAGLGRSIAPVIATSAFALSGPTTPFIGGGILVVLAAVLAFASVSSIHKPVAIASVSDKDTAETVFRKHERQATRAK
jgi:MFS transporter, DHA1 family, tetracycline resistance protein